MKIGTLDQRIRLDYKVVTQDANYGTEVITWMTFATVWASVQDVLPSKSERLTDDIVLANRPARIRIRYLDGVTSAMRVILLDRGDRELKIVSGPAELGRKEGMEMMAENYSTSGQAV